MTIVIVNVMFAWSLSLGGTKRSPSNWPPLGEISGKRVSSPAVPFGDPGLVIIWANSQFEHTNDSSPRRELGATTGLTRGDAKNSLAVEEGDSLVTEEVGISPVGEKD